jgi:hypothetical protein
MHLGHISAQSMLRDIIEGRGLRFAKTFSPTLPTDGVGFAPIGLGPFADVPMVAAEVVASESPKGWRGSLHTLERVSPALAVLVFQDEEYRRRLGRRGWDVDVIERSIANTLATMNEEVAASRQRVIILTMDQLRYQHRVHTARSPR